MPTPRPSRQRRFARAGRVLCLGAALAGCACIPTVAHAQAAPAAQAPELSSVASDAIGPIREDLKSEDPQKYPELLRKLDGMIATLKLTGYDLAYINSIKVNLLIKSGQPLKAIQPLEDTLVGNYFPKDVQLGMTLALSQLYMQDAGLTNDTKLREKRLGQARARLETWFAAVPEPLLGGANMQSYIDAMSLYANCLYFLKDYQKSYETSMRLVRLSIEPNDQAWVLLFAAQQEAGKNAEAAETFELFIRKFPNKKDFWLQLTQAYLSSNQSLRAILSYQRAQEHGFMTSPSDYMNVFGLYYRLDEYSRASQLLESWIKSGKVEDSEENWETVSYCMANLRRDDAVRTILDSARKRFKTGNLDFALAQYLWYDGKYKEGLEAATIAWKKDGLKKKGRTALFLATANFEQRNYDLAVEFFEIAKKSGDIEKADIDRVGRILEEAVKIIRDRNAEAGTTPATHS
jgi:cytochrome c-type biogenesis protein CcmH/NrfG